MVGMADYIVYTDGGARGNPGPAGVGASIQDATGNEVATVSEYIGETTNNMAEYHGAILGLKKLKSLIGKNKTKDASVELRMDSELVVKQLTGVYQLKEETLHTPFIAIHNMRVADFPKLTITHVRREDNARADQLANEAMDEGVSTGDNTLF